MGVMISVVNGCNDKCCQSGCVSVWLCVPLVSCLCLAVCPTNVMSLSGCVSH